MPKNAKEMTDFADVYVMAHAGHFKGSTCRKEPRVENPVTQDSRQNNVNPPNPPGR